MQSAQKNLTGKIGIDARAAVWYRGTGIGTYTYQLLHHLKQSEEAAHYRLFWQGEEIQGLDIAKREHFRKLEKNRNYWGEIFLPEVIEKEGIKLYHVPQNGIGLPQKKTCQQVVTIHDLIPYLYPETVGKGYLQEFLGHMPAVMQNADHIITVSECAKQDICNIFAYPEAQITVIPEAAEPFYRPIPKQACREFLHEKYGITKPFLLYVGGFGSRKNLRGLMVAHALAMRELKQEYLLVCPGRLRAEEDDYTLTTALGTADCVHFPGYVAAEELPYFYGAAEVFVYPSFYEGFGLPPLEAFACGTPVICSGTSSLPEVTGDAALLIDPRNAQEIAKAAVQVLTEPALAETLRQKGLERAKAFSWAKTAAATAEVYDKMLE